MRPQGHAERGDRTKVLWPRHLGHLGRQRGGPRPLADERPTEQTGRCQREEHDPRAREDHPSRVHRVGVALADDDDVAERRRTAVGWQVWAGPNSLCEGVERRPVHNAAQLDVPTRRRRRKGDLVQRSKPTVQHRRLVVDRRRQREASGAAGVDDHCRAFHRASRPIPCPGDDPLSPRATLLSKGYRGVPTRADDD